MENGALSKSVLARVLIRTFLLQGSWNFERMQNLGTLFALAPALRRLYGEERSLKEAYRRHLDYFNTHPFLAGPVLGVTLALEEQEASGEKSPVGVKEFKGMIMAPYAAMGDALFWGGIRPLAAVLALFFALRGSMLAPVVFLLAFNLPHLWIRTRGFILGYRQGLGVVQLMQRQRLPDLAIRLKETTIILLGGLSALLVYQVLKGHGVSTGWGLLGLPVVGGLMFISRKGVSPLQISLGGAAIVILILGAIYR